MKKQIILSDKAPKPIGPYSQAVQVGNMIYASGMLPIDPETGVIPEGVEKQTHQIFKNIKALLEEAGIDFINVVKTTVFLKDMNDFQAMNNIYSTYFTDQYPARSAIEVSRLPKDVSIEVEIIAYQE